MSQSILNTLEVKDFEAEVHQVFQEQGNRFMEAARTRRTSGNSVQFPVLGKLRATERVIGTPIVTSNQTAAAVVVTLGHYTVAQYTDIFLQSEINFDAKREAATSVALACSRKLDQIAINALAAGSYSASNQVATNISGSADGLRFASITRARTLLDRVTNMNNTERYFVAFTDDIHHMITADKAEVASQDYVNRLTLVDGKVSDQVYGFKFIPIGLMDDEDGLPWNTSTDVIRSFAFLKPALGMAVNMSPEIKIDWVAHMGAWLVAAYLSAGAGIIDNTGVIEVSTDQSP